jgi:hypothetical protein
MHASNKQRTWKNRRKIGPATIITFPRLPTPLDAVRRWAQRLDLLPHHSPLSAQPLCVHARIAVRSLLEMTDWNDCR